MNILCAGINHHIAPVDVRERLAVASHEVAEGHRRRVYRATPKGRRALQQMRAALRELADEVLD